MKIKNKSKLNSFHVNATCLLKNYKNMFIISQQTHKALQIINVNVEIL